MHGNLNVKFEKRMFVLRCTRWEVRILSPSIMSLLQLRTIMYTWRHWLPIAMRRNERATSVGTQAFIFSDTSYVFSSDCPVTFVLSFIPEIFKVSPAYSVNFLFKSIPQTLQCIKVQKRKKGREAYFFYDASNGVGGRRKKYEDGALLEGKWQAEPKYPGAGTYLSTIFSTTNPPRTGLRSNPGFRENWRRSHRRKK